MMLYQEIRLSVGNVYTELSKVRPRRGECFPLRLMWKRQNVYTASLRPALWKQWTIEFQIMDLICMHGYPFLRQITSFLDALEHHLIYHTKLQELPLTEGT